LVYPNKTSNLLKTKEKEQKINTRKETRQSEKLTNDPLKETRLGYQVPTKDKTERLYVWRIQIDLEKGNLKNNICFRDSRVKTSIIYPLSDWNRFCPLKVPGTYS
jgi:hypothetical protein